MRDPNQEPHVIKWLTAIPGLPVHYYTPAGLFDFPYAKAEIFPNRAAAETALEAYTVLHPEPPVPGMEEFRIELAGEPMIETGPHGG